MSGFMKGVKRGAKRAVQGGAAPAAGAEGAAGLSAQMSSVAMQDERKKRMGRNRSTIMQDRFGG